MLAQQCSVQVNKNAELVSLYFNTRADNHVCGNYRWQPTTEFVSQLLGVF